MGATVKLVTLLAYLVVFTGCARIPEGMKEAKSGDRIVYRIPAESVDGEDKYWGIDFKAKTYQSARSGFKYRRTARIVGKDDDRCEITISCLITPIPKKTKLSAVTTARTFVFGVDRWQRKGVATVEFRPLFEATQPDSPIHGPEISPPDTLESAMEVLATSGIFTFQIEVESARAPDAILANFRKFCREQSHLQHPVVIKSRTFTTSYLLASGTKPVATFYLSLSPSGKRTAVSVITRLPLAPDANYQVDAVRQASDMKQVVSDIINN
jgi:hypothetical protein